jgi:hypothetical protein
MGLHTILKKSANNSLHRTAIPLRSIAAGELGRSASTLYYDSKKGVSPIIYNNGLEAGHKSMILFEPG